MAGTTIPLFTMRNFDMDSIGNGGSDSQILVKAVDVSGYTEGQLMVRSHSGTISSTASFYVIATPTLPSSEDPSEDFLGSTPVGTVTIDSNHVGANAPMLVTGDLSSGFGAMLQIKITGNQAGTATDLNAVLSADLVVKD